MFSSQKCIEMPNKHLSRRFQFKETTFSLLFALVPRGYSRVLREFQILARSTARSAEIEMPQAYCVKCKANIEIKNPQNVTLKNGKAAVKGTCPNCGTSVFRIGKG